MRRREGMTLIELMVVMTLLSIMAGVVTMSLRATPTARTLDGAFSDIARARDSALRYGHVVTIVVLVGGVGRMATAYPDGRVQADSTLRFSPLTGHPRDATR